MGDQVFVDGIGTISVIGGTVRLDFVAYSPTEKDQSGQPVAAFRQQIIMGMDAFLQAAGRIYEAAQTLATRSGRPEQTGFAPVAAAPQPAAPPSTPPQSVEPVATFPKKPPFP